MNIRVRCEAPKYARGEYTFHSLEELYHWLDSIWSVRAHARVRDETLSIIPYIVAKHGFLSKSRRGLDLHITADTHNRALAATLARKVGLIKKSGGFKPRRDAALAFAKAFDAEIGLPPRMTYNEVFLKAWEGLLKEYGDGRVKLLSEADLQSHLFSGCLRLMKTEGFETPYRIHTNKSVLSRRQKTDLVLGSDEVAVEVKLEPDYPGVSKPVVFREDVEKDIARLDEYLRRGVKHAHFVMIDEDGFHKRNPRVRGWKTMKVGDRERYYLHVSRSPTND